MKKIVYKIKKVCYIRFMAIVRIVGKSECPRNFTQKTYLCFLKKAGMLEHTLVNKYGVFQFFDDIAMRFYEDDGRLGRALRKALHEAGLSRKRAITYADR